MSVRWLATLALFTTTGCAAGMLISPAQEVEIGQGVDKQIEGEYKILDKSDPLYGWANKLVQRIGTASNHFRDSSEFGGYKVEVIADDKLVNAFAAPGGYVYITTGLISSANSCADIAGVIGHELAHVTQKHSVRQIERAFAAETLAGFFLQQGLAQDAALTIFSFLQATTFSREQEAEADEVGLQIAHDAGYNPYGLADFFRVLLQQEKGGGRVPTFLSSHPATADRVHDVEARIKQLYDGKVVKGKTPHYDCVGTEWQLEQAQQHIKSGDLKVRPGTGNKPASGG
jgi:predicted Zn-dependent protease